MDESVSAIYHKFPSRETRHATQQLAFILEGGRYIARVNEIGQD